MCQIRYGDTVVDVAFNLYSHVANNCEYTSLLNNIFHVCQYYRMNADATNPR